MQDKQIRTLADLQSFLAGSSEIDIKVDEGERYSFILRIVKRFKYQKLLRADKAIVLRFLEHVSGYSKPQIARLVKRACAGRSLVKRYRGTRTSYTRVYTDADVLLLAYTDATHSTMSGMGTKKILERAFGLFHDKRYERLSNISVAQIYNIRHRAAYLNVREFHTKTKNSAVSIGERRAPTPNDQPGFLRVDSVHQGDLDGVKGVYQINAVDCVTQYEYVATCERISEAFLLPLLEEMLQNFPFEILGFHTDNGSEYINKHVTKLLSQLLIKEQTKSRSRHSNDNALAESKNGSIIRKHLGFAHIPQRFAPLVNKFCKEFLNPYINFHRPCFFAEIKTDSKGKQVKTYPLKLMQTPYQKLKSIPNAEQYLRDGITFEMLDAQAFEMSDNEAAEQKNEANIALWKTINE